MLFVTNQVKIRLRGTARFKETTMIQVNQRAMGFGKLRM
jgi:hypothetical protein